MPPASARPIPHVRPEMHPRHAGGPGATARRAGALLAAAAGLAGCATAPDADSDAPRYIAPAPGQPGARLLIRGSVPAGDKLVVLRHRDALQCAQPELLTETLPPQAAPAVTIAAEALTTLDLQVLRPGGSRTCAINLSFTPRTGRSYLVQAAPTGSSCTVALVDVSRPDRPQAVPDFTPRTTASQRCLPLAAAQAAMQAARPATPLIQGGQDAAGEPVLNPRATSRDLEGLIRP